MNKITDSFGQVIQKDDYITYPIRQGSDMWLGVMRVDGFREKMTNNYIENTDTGLYENKPIKSHTISGYVISAYRCWVKDSTGGREFVQEDFPAKFFKKGMITDSIIDSLNAHGIKEVTVFYPHKTTVFSLNRIIKLPPDCSFNKKTVLQTLKIDLVF